MTDYLFFLIIGFIVFSVGFAGMYKEIGYTDDKQFGKDSTKKMFTGILISIFGLGIIVFTLSLHAIFG